MKITRKNLKRLIESYLAEGTLSQRERDLIRAQVEVELGEEFELLARQAKSLEDFNRMEKIFLADVEKETQRRIAAAAAAKPDGEYDEMRVKIEDKPKWSDQDWNDAFNQNQEIVPYESAHIEQPRYEDPAMIDVTPDADGDNDYMNTPTNRPLTSMDMSRRNFLKSAGMGLAAAGQIAKIGGLFDGDLFDGQNLSGHTITALAYDEEGVEIEFEMPVEILENLYYDLAMAYKDGLVAHEKIRRIIESYVKMVADNVSELSDIDLSKEWRTNLFTIEGIPSMSDLNTNLDPNHDMYFRTQNEEKLVKLKDVYFLFFTELFENVESMGAKFQSVGTHPCFMYAESVTGQDIATVHNADVLNQEYLEKNGLIKK